VIEIEVEQKLVYCVRLRMLLKLRLKNNFKKYILIFIIFNLNIVDLTIAIAS
jgi:hypothetical protein